MSIRLYTSQRVGGDSLARIQEGKPGVGQVLASRLTWDIAGRLRQGGHALEREAGAPYLVSGRPSWSGRSTRPEWELEDVAGAFFGAILTIGLSAPAPDAGVDCE